MVVSRRRLARYCAVPAVSLGAALAIAASPAQASGVLNSECSGSTAGFVPIWGGSVAAQTFVANSTGALLKVDLKNISRAAGGAGGDISVQVYGTDETGTPVVPVLASTAIQNASITANGFYHDYSAEFEPTTAAYLSSGGTYGIAVSTADTVQNVWGFGENLCPSVALFTGGPPFGPPLGHSDWDAGLRTYLGPANDNFEHAQVLSGQNAGAEGTTAGATRQEPDEPDHYVTNPPDSDLWVGDHSVWYRWTAPNSGPTTIDTCTGEIDSILAVYTGSQLNALTRVADNNNDPACATADPYGSKVSFEAVAGTTYDIAVGDAGGAREKPFTLAIAGAPDTVPPETQIDSGPTGPTEDASPSFTFSSEPGATFECRLDASQEAAFKACTSPKSYSALSSGPHTFEVRAIDEAANPDPTPASRSFTIEIKGHEQKVQPPKSIPPDSSIRKVKVNQAKDTATFRFSSTKPGSTFFCQLDHKPFKACKSPKTYRHLKPGRHRFQVEAVDPAGEPDPTPAVRAFKLRS